MRERWKDIVGYEGMYQVSNLGRIKSVAREKTHSNGSVHPVRERILKFGKNEAGYNHVVLCARKGKRHKTTRVSRLVAKAFLKRIPRKPYVNHKNGIRSDDRVQNLEWVNASENQTHSYIVLNKGATLPRGSKRKGSKLTESEVANIRRLWGSGAYSQDAIATQFGVKQPTISEIVNNKYWNKL